MKISIGSKNKSIPKMHKRFKTSNNYQQNKEKHKEPAV